MNNHDDILRDRLTVIADQAAPADLYGRSLARSRQIGRRRLVVACAATLAIATVVTGTTWHVNGLRRQPPPGASTAPSISATPDSSASTTPASADRSLPGLPGWLYYHYFPKPGQLQGLVRVENGKPTPITVPQDWNANVSPDGTAIATIDGTGTLVVTDRDGGHPRYVAHDLTTYGHEPAWSPDSRKVLVARGNPTATAFVQPEPGIVDIATGTFTPLARNARGIHYLWSGNGDHIAYAQGSCQIATADIDGDNQHIVPVIGVHDRTINPGFAHSCDPYSVSPDAGRIAVDLRTDTMDTTDITRNLQATAIIDAATGHAVALPVAGTLSAAFYLPDGSLLLRTTVNGTTMLTLLSPDSTVIGQATEPPILAAARLVAYIAR